MAARVELKPGDLDWFHRKSTTALVALQLRSDEFSDTSASLEAEANHLKRLIQLWAEQFAAA